MGFVIGKASLRLTAMSIAMAMLAGCVVADSSAPPYGRRDRPGTGYEERPGTSVDFRFTSDDRRIVMDYYGAQVRRGKCPPGLAKKNNGCQPPGQAKKWQRGRPLPRDVVYYALPREVSVRLRVPPPNYRYVQIAGDVLLIAIGTRLVIDAIEDIGRYNDDRGNRDDRR